MTQSTCAFLTLSLTLLAFGCTSTTPKDTDEQPKETPKIADKAPAPNLAPNEIQTTAGKLTITPIEHGTFYMTWNKKVIYIDPVGKSLNMASGNKPDALPKADVILITDIHGDHLDPAGAKMVSTQDTVLITAKAVATKAGDALKTTTLLANGESTKIFGDTVLVEAIPMYNIKRKRPNGELFHVKGRGNGYILNMGGKRVYISGDTACTPEMRALKNIDAAFVTMNLPYTMTVEEAAECIRAFKPAHLYPFHYRGQDPSKLNTLLKDVPQTKVHLMQWYPKAKETTPSTPAEATK